MNSFTIVWRPRDLRDLLALYDWIASRAGPETAFLYTSRIENHAGTLVDFPERGTPRDDLMSGLRTIPYRRRTTIAYQVTGRRVEILALAHAGQLLDGPFDD